jgi:hypothetical protein
MPADWQAIHEYRSYRHTLAEALQCAISAACRTILALASHFMEHSHTMT